MKIRIKKDITVPAGFYCDGCQYMERDANYPSDEKWGCYCREFYGFIDIATNGKRVKQDACLLACRESLMEG